MKHCVIFLMTLLSGTVMARTEISERELATKLKQYERMTALEAPFQQLKILKEMGITLKSEGRLTVVRPSHVVWEITKPSPVRVTLTRRSSRLRAELGRIRALKSLN